MHFAKSLLSLSALLGLVAAYPSGAASSSSLVPRADAKNGTILDVELAVLELEIELEIAIRNGVLEIDLEIEIGDVEILDLDIDVTLPTLPAPLDGILPALLPIRSVEIERRHMAEITCALPHTRLDSQAGEVFRKHFASLNEGSYNIPAHKHMTWKIGRDRFKVENHTGKDVVGLKYADNEFAAQQFALVCPNGCKGRACLGKDVAFDEKIKNRIFSV